MKKKILALTMCLILVLGIITTVQADEPFADVPPTHWAFDEVSALRELNVISGSGDGNFSPDSNITKEQFLKMVINAFGVPASQTSISFDDVKSGAWYEEYIKTGIAYGIVTGKSESTFGVGENITRQDACVMIMRASAISKNADSAVSFADEDKISSYAKDAVYALTSNSIVAGFSDNTFRPKELCTKAQAAKIIKSALDTELTYMDDAKKIIFLGDSITNAGEYIIYVDAFLKTRFPNAKIDVLFGGVDGESIVHMLARYKEEITDKAPDEVFIMFGTNDVNRGLYPDGSEEKKQYAINTSATNLDTLIKQLKADGISNITIITPPAIDEREYAGASANQRIGASDGVKNLAAKCAEVAKSHGLRIIDVYTPTRAILDGRKDSGKVEIFKTDRIHPNRLGHFVLASEIIKAAYADYGLVASVNIDANAVSYTSDNALISDFDITDGKLSYSYTAKSLPMGIDTKNITEGIAGNGYTDAVEAYPEFIDFTEKMNREIIKVTGLSEGTYEIAFDGKVITTATSEELLNGVNIATLSENPGQIKAKSVINTYMQNYWTMIKDRRCEVLTRKVKEGGMYEASLEELTEWVNATYPGVSAWKSYLTIYQDADTYAAQWSFIDRYVYKLNQPETYNVTITPVN